MMHQFVTPVWDKTFALQKAGQAVRNKETYCHPYFWAPLWCWGSGGKITFFA
jgi:CHAT domain-containing protein